MAVIGRLFHVKQNDIEERKQTMSFYEISFDDMWDCLIKMVGISEETLIIVCAVAGNNRNTLEAVLYATTGHRNFYQLIEQD